MHNAAAERLSQILSDPSPEMDSDNKMHVVLSRIHLRLEEGWFSLFLLALVVYCSVWCIQVTQWIEHLQVLTLTTAIGLLVGVCVAKQHRLSSFLVYSCTALLGLALAVWQTTNAFYSGNYWHYLQGFWHWFLLVLGGGNSNDDAIYLFAIILLTFALAVISALLLYRWRQPWLLIIANTIVLLFNLNILQASSIFFLVIFLISSLVLLLRFNLYESMKRWRRLGLRYPDDLGWDVMQAGVFVSIGMLIFSWILPGQYVDSYASQIWSSPGSPLQGIESLWGSTVGATESSPANHGSFRDSLILGGNPDLTNDIVLKVKFSSAQPQYLTLVSYDTYDNGWSIQDADKQKYPIKANEELASDARVTQPLQQSIQLVEPLDEQQAYLLGATDITTVSLPTSVIVSSGGIVGWLSNNGGLKAGTHYTVTSQISAADESDLREIPMPDQAPKVVPSHGLVDEPLPIEYFDPQTVTDFTQIPAYLQKDHRIAALAQKIVSDAHATTMYDKVEAIETYLRSHYAYNTNIRPSPGVDPVLWFLFGNPQKDGYCNYFASAMTLLVRSLGIPARFAVGYTYGTQQQGSYVVRGVDAHGWTQVYFAGYGWINFEPSASFKTFVRPSPSQTSASTSSTVTSNQSGLTVSNLNSKNHSKLASQNSGGSNSTSTKSHGQTTQVDLTLGIFGFFILLIGALFFFWWRRLFRHYSLASQLYGRMCVLADWAGIRHKNSQTPYEYAQQLSAVVLPLSEYSQDLEKLSDIYVRERWSDPASDEHPLHTGELDELPVLWRRVRPQLFRYVMQHPMFLTSIPTRIGQGVYWVQKKLHTFHEARKSWRENF